MPLPWVRLDTTLPGNPKILTLVAGKKYQAFTTYVCSLSWAGAQGTDGFIPTIALPMIHGTPQSAKDLVSAGLWHTDKAGWIIPDWSEYQQTSEQTNETKAKARAASKKANCVRHHGPECGCWRRPPD